MSDGGVRRDLDSHSKNCPCRSYWLNVTAKQKQELWLWARAYGIMEGTVQGMQHVKIDPKPCAWNEVVSLGAECVWNGVFETREYECFETWVGGYVLMNVWMWSSAAWKGWKTGKNTVLCWECNLAWIKSSFPGSRSVCWSLPGNGNFFIFFCR